MVVLLGVGAFIEAFPFKPKFELENEADGDFTVCG